MIRIQIITRNQPRRVVKLSRMRMTIGRSPRTDLPIDDPFASRLHAELRSIGDGVWVTDMGSANGTRVNNAVIGGSVVLAPGDQIQIGETTLDLFEEAEIAAREPSEPTLSPRCESWEGRPRLPRSRRS